MSGPWARFPAGLSDKPAEVQLAWMLLLDRWHQGKDAGPRLLRAHFKWGGSQADRVYKEVIQWAEEVGAIGPNHKPAKAPGQSRVTTGSEPGQAAKVEAQQKEKIGSQPGHNRVTTGSGTPQNPPPTSPPAPLKTEIEIKNCLTPPTPSPGSPGSGSPPAQEGGQASESLIFLGSADREALARHGIKTVSGLKAAHKRQPLRYLKGVGEARANRIFGLLAEKFPNDPELASQATSTTSPANAEAGFDEIANNFWKSKETPNAIANA